MKKRTKKKATKKRIVKKRAKTVKVKKHHPVVATHICKGCKEKVTILKWGRFCREECYSNFLRNSLNKDALCLPD